MNLLEDCTLAPLNESLIASCYPFDCGNSDLNEFFSQDSIKYSSELLGKTYCFTLDSDDKKIITAFTIANDSVKTTNLGSGVKKRVTKNIPRAKTMRSYPAVLIGRLGVVTGIARSGLGGQVLNFIKSWFIDGKNKTGCRYIVVDAYNEDIPLAFYTKNGFDFLFNTEKEEKEFLKIKSEEKLNTRFMYFDLILLYRDRILSMNSEVDVKSSPEDIAKSA